MQFPAIIKKVHCSNGQKQSFAYIFKVGLFKYFAIFTGKHLIWSLF